MVKQYKARIESPGVNWHAMIVFLEAENIADAIEDVKSTLSCLGIGNENITFLVETQHRGD